MEYVPDVFRNHISSETPLPAERVVEIGREISLALSHAHSYDVVHRGIKPQNILLVVELIGRRIWARDCIANKVIHH